MWLESMDPVSEALTGDPFSPTTQRSLPSISRLELVVFDKYLVYSSTDILPDVA